MKCKLCHNRIEGNWIVCPYCETLIEKNFFCPECKREINFDWKVCPFCTTDLLSLKINEYDEEETDDETVTDIDDNVYNTVTIGSQVWMVENLKTTHYRNGDDIPNITDDAEWKNLTTGAYCNYHNLPGNADIYGRLYNWYAVNDPRGLAPEGWHIPSDEEWKFLIDWIDHRGGKLKEAGLAHWYAPNRYATNETGFNAIPGGLRGREGTFKLIGGDSYWWSSSEDGTDKAINRSIITELGNIFDESLQKILGHSVRCIRNDD